MGMKKARLLPEELDLKSTARKALLLSSSLLAWAGEGYLLFNLWSARSAQSGAPASMYFVSVAHLLPWAVGMKSLWNVRRAVQSGALGAAGADSCNGIVEE